MNRMMIVASLAVLSLLPYQALSLGEGVSATDKRADISLHIFVNIPKTLYTEGKFHFSFENILFCKRIIIFKWHKQRICNLMTFTGKLRTTGTTGKENDFTCPDRWGYFADPKNCIKYYVCKEGIPTRMTCQKSNHTQRICRTHNI